MKKRFWFVNVMLAVVLVLSLGLSACGDNGGDPQTVPVTSVTLNKSTLTLDIGGSETLTATVLPDNATNNTVTWTVAPAGIVTVSNGTVTAVTDGTATVTATADGKSATCTVTVNPPIGGKTDVTSVTLNKSEITLDIGGSETLTATVLPENATNKTVSWSSDKPAIADVDDNGKVTAKADGTAVITATADGVSDTCTVTVNKATLNPDDEPLFGMVKIAKALEDKFNYNIQAIFEIEVDSEKYLSYINKSAMNYQFISTEIKTAGHNLTSLSSNDLSYYETAINALTTNEIYVDSSYSVGTFTTDNDNARVTAILNKLIGEDLDEEYTILYGSLGVATQNGANKWGNNASFNVNATLLCNNGKIVKYSNRITAATDGVNSAYDAVLDSILYEEDNEKFETIYEGTVAKAYLDELAAYEAYHYPLLTIGKALERKLNEDGFDFDILAVYEVENDGANYLAFLVDRGVDIYNGRTAIPTAGHSLTKPTSEDLEYFLEAIENFDITARRSVFEINVIVKSEINADIVDDILAKLVGTDYQILYGVVGQIFPTADKCNFQVYAYLIGQDGNIYYYVAGVTTSLTIDPTAYYVVLHGIEGNVWNKVDAFEILEGTNAYLDELAAYKA